MRKLDEQLITIFGGGGFVGRYVVQALLAPHVRVRIAQRHPAQAEFLKPLGEVGQIQFVAANVRNISSVENAAKGSDAIVNLVGSFGDMEAVQYHGAAHIAAAAQRLGVKKLVHMSAIGADPKSPSAYGRSKGNGEIAVREAFPNATILRPSVIFGQEDHFINRFATLIRMMPIVPVIAPSARFQPVYVGDVAAAVAAVLANPRGTSNPSRTRSTRSTRSLGNSGDSGDLLELGGPQIISMMELMRWIADAIDRKPLFAAMPDSIAVALARLTGWMPGAPITYDQWLMLKKDNIIADTASSKTSETGKGDNGLQSLAIIPTPLASVAAGWLVQYRRHGRFALRTTERTTERTTV